MKARDNPFSTDRVLRIRYRPQGWTWETLLARLEAMRYRGAIVGPKGTGKTTLLEDLVEHLERRSFRCRLIRLSSENRRIDPAAVDRLAGGDILILDGAEQLSAARWAWVRFRARRAGGLVISTHVPGRLSTLLCTETTRHLLAEIITELLPCDDVSDHQVASLFSRHTGNLREALRELYDRCPVGCSIVAGVGGQPERSGLQ